MSSLASLFLVSLVLVLLNLDSTPRGVALAWRESWWDSFKSMCRPHCPRPFGLAWISCTHLLLSYKTLLNSSCVSQIGPMCLLVKIFWLFWGSFVCKFARIPDVVLGFLPQRHWFSSLVGWGCMDIWCHWSLLWIWCMHSWFCYLVVLSTFMHRFGDIQ